MWKRKGINLCVITCGVACVSALAQQTPAQPLEANEMFPQWSHDGKKIVFTSHRDGDPEIYVMNADGSSLVCLTAISK